jgi:hypothetical protein
MSKINLIKFQQKYGGKYIARKGNKVILSAKTFNYLVKKIKINHLTAKNFIFTYIPPKGAICI